MIGDYQLNTVICADSYEAIKTIPDKSVDCIYTDIPYLYKQMDGGGTFGNRERPSRDEIKFIKDGIDIDILKDMVRVMKKINIFIWCSRLQVLDIMKWFDENTNTNFDILVWGKTNPIPSANNGWLPDLEYCLYFRDKGVKLNDGYHLKSKYHISSINKHDKDLYAHPTIKPLNLVKRHLLHATQPDDIIFDPFMGSGTVGEACRDLERDFIGSEIEQKWCDIANDRINGILANGQTSIFTDFDEKKEQI